MLRSLKELEKCAIRATDGPIGHLADLYFDDEAWTIRYLVVDTGTWLSQRKVLLSPIAVMRTKWTDHSIPVSLTKDQIEKSPDIDTQMPVSRQHEITWLGHYGYPIYWEGSGLWGVGGYPGVLGPAVGAFDVTSPVGQSTVGQLYAAAELKRHAHDDLHLRSCDEVMHYQIHASDGDLGRVQGFLVDEDTWQIRFLVVGTSNWWLGHLVLVSPEWIVDVNWPDARLSVNLTREQVRSAPPYEPTLKLDREAEAGVFEHYGRIGTWTADPKPHRDSAGIGAHGQHGA